MPQTIDIEVFLSGACGTENEGQVKYRISVSNVENMDQPISVANMPPVPCGYFQCDVTATLRIARAISS